MIGLLSPRKAEVFFCSVPSQADVPFHLLVWYFTGSARIGCKYFSLPGYPWRKWSDWLQSHIYGWSWLLLFAEGVVFLEPKKIIKEISEEQTPVDKNLSSTAIKYAFKFLTKLGQDSNHQSLIALLGQVLEKRERKSTSLGTMTMKLEGLIQTITTLPCLQRAICILQPFLHQVC